MQRALHDIVAQVVAQLWTKIALLTYQFALSGVDKINLVGARGKTSRYEDSNL